MRARLELPLAALILLFLLQGLAALFATLFALVYDAVFDGRQSAWAQMLVPLGALLVPALPLARRVGRERLLASAAATAALARIALCFPSFSARWLASAALVGAGAMFLSAAVGLLDRRALTAGAAGALLLEQLLRFIGWSWDALLRPGAPVLMQVVLSAIAAALAGYWLLQPRTADADATLERRLGGMRLRGAVALGCTLFLELVVLARPAVAARWTDAPYPVMAFVLIAISAAAVAMLARRTLPVESYRAITVTCALIATIAASTAPLLPDVLATLLLPAGHAAALVLLAPALTPAGGSRKGWVLAVAPSLLVIFAALHALTFFAAFTIPALHARGPVIVAAAGVLLVLVMLLLPRPLPAAPAHGGTAAALAAGALLAAAALLLRDRLPAAPAALATEVRVATYNVHLGFTQDWRFDPERIAATIREHGVDVVALQEAPVGLMVAYGVDLPLWLGHRLGMYSVFAPSKGELLGDALLSRSALQSVSAVRLPPAGGDHRALVRGTLRTAAGPLVVAGTHLGLTDAEQRVQVETVVRALGDASRAVLLGDLNAGPGSGVDQLLAAAGLADAFELARSTPAPTWPALAPSQRIDWLRVRGYDVSVASTSAGGGSDHLLVGATLLAPAPSSGDVQRP